MGVSEIFQDVFDSRAGGCIRECDCGRTYFDGSYGGGWGWEDGELEGLKEQALKLPDKYFNCDHSIGGLEINGLFFVHDCICGGSERYELFLINEDSRVAEYLNRRSEELKRKAESMRVKI